MFTNPWKIAACLLVLVSLVLLASGCGEQAESKPKLVVLCGSSFVPPIEQLINEFEAATGVTVEYTTAGSEDFLPQVKAAAIGDILVTHDPYLDYVRQAGRYADQVTVGYVAPVLAVQPGNPRKLTRIEDLAKPNLRVALSNPKYSTCGEMVFALLKKKGILDAVMANVGNRLTKGHSELGNLVKTDAVDAVMMWNGVAHTFLPKIQVVATPYEYDHEIRVHVIALNYSAHPDLVRQFMDLVRRRGKAAFAEHGYVK